MAGRGNFSSHEGKAKNKMTREMLFSRALRIDSLTFSDDRVGCDCRMHAFSDVALRQMEWNRLIDKPATRRSWLSREKARLCAPQPVGAEAGGTGPAIFNMLEHPVPLQWLPHASGFTDPSSNNASPWRQLHRGRQRRYPHRLHLRRYRRLLCLLR